MDRAANGEEALVRIHNAHYDVVICDLKMPKVDGMMFFREVSQSMPHVAKRLVFVTGDVAGTEAERFLEESGCRWVPKPFRLRDLVTGGEGDARVDHQDQLRTSNPELRTAEDHA